MRQRGNRQLPVRDDTGEQNGHHQQCCGDRSQNENAGRTHGDPYSVGVEGKFVAETCIFDPSTNFSKLLLATTLPG